MKKFISRFVIVLTIILPVGCHRETLPEDSSESGFKITEITAYNADAQSKTVLSEDGTKLLWNPGDQISVFYNCIKASYHSINTKPKDKAIFVDFDDRYVSYNPAMDSYIYAVYPAGFGEYQITDTLHLTLPCLQLAVTGSVAQDSFVSVGRSKDTNIPFYNLCGGICFSVSEPGVKFISILGNDNESLAGDVGVVFNEDGYPVVACIDDGIKRIELVAPSIEGFEVGKKYYISMLPVSLSKGFTMTFMKETSRATLTTSSAVSVKRSTFGNLGIADQGLEYVEVKPQAVDLGLSVKWATFNVGATAPEEYGYWFKFGEVKGILINDMYALDEVSPVYEFDTTDYHLLPQYDAAAVNWGSGWRMPSKAESDELFNNTTRKWEYDYKGMGIYGIILTSKVEGYTDKSIFLPGQWDVPWATWYYWTGTCVWAYPYLAAFCMDDDGWFNTYVPGSVRPVIE